jgi:putative spermidine/putrescine transport system substrate-binding protein
MPASSTRSTTASSRTPQPAGLDEIPYGVGHIYSGKVGVYNPKLIEPAPKSYKDIFNPKHGNKLGIIDIQYQYTLVCAALAAGGKVNDLEPGKKLLLECKKAGARIYPTNEAFAQGLKTEEFGTGVMWKARVVQWQNAGISVQADRAERGGARLRVGLRHPRRMRPTRPAPTPTSTPCSRRARRRPSPSTWATTRPSRMRSSRPISTRASALRPAKSRQLVDLDYGYMTQNDVALKEWWDKELKG